MKESSDIDLLQYMRIIAKRKKLVLLVTLACLAIAWTASSRMTPVYEATAEMLIVQDELTPTERPFGESYQAVLMNEKLANTYSQMLKERTVAEKVIHKLSLDVEPSDLVKRIDARPIQDTQLIKVTVADTDPGRASRIANALGGVLRQSVREISPSSLVFASDVKIVEPAISPREPVAPKPALYMIVAVLFGLSGSFGLALLFERLDTTIKSVDDAEALSGLPSLGSIPAAYGNNLVSGWDSQSRVSDAYRHLRTKIHHMDFDSTPLITVTGPGSRDGKTSLALNLGAVLAQAGHKVLLIDCDIRKPDIHYIFELGNDIGVSNVVLGGVDLAQAIQPSAITGLHVLTSGPQPPHAADLFSSEKMDMLLHAAQELFDYVILDSPPVLAVPDAVILASKTNGTLVSAAYGKTTKEALIKSKAELEKVGAHVIGFVLSGAILRERGYDVYYQSERKEAVPKKKGPRRTLTPILIISIASLIAFVLVLSLSLWGSRW
jgi:receptor protein-tyrosine kinase